MPEFLYDHPREFYLYGCVTKGVFDPEKAESLGYGPTQVEEIIKFLALEQVDASRLDTNPLPEIEEVEDD